MSSVWTTRYRLLLEWCEELAGRLSDEQPVAEAAVEEQAVRLLMGTVRLLRQHEVNKRGQCKFCGWTRWGMRFWRRRRQCTVYSVLVFAVEQGLDAVWWQLSVDRGQKVTLAQVREWVEERAPARR
ncbi:MAG: hypothetical protein ACRDUV_25775 [Pseudonocardiaceae bacterium]